MTQNEKDLLIKDLSARLPYGVKAYVRNWSKIDRKYYEGVYIVDTVCPSSNTVLVTSDKFAVDVIVGYDYYEIKPYLFPLSSMTEEQKRELYNLVEETAFQIIHSEDGNPQPHIAMDWYNKNHFDYRGLIPMGLANDATGLNIY